VPRAVIARTCAVPVLPHIWMPSSWSLLPTPVPWPLTTLNMPSRVTWSCSGVNGNSGPNGFGCPNISDGSRFLPLAIREVMTASCSGETET